MPIRSVSMLNGKSAISVAIRKQSGVNTVRLADAIRERMAEVEKLLPPTFEVRLIRDDSEFIRASLAAIEHLILGGILAAIIVLVFLRTARPDRGGRHPGSIIGAFGVMSALNFTINQMTMLALTSWSASSSTTRSWCSRTSIDSSKRRDDAAACRGRGDQGNRPRGHGHDDVAPGGVPAGRPSAASSAVSCRRSASTSAAAIAISLIVSFTLTPMLASRWIKHDHDNRASDESRRGFYRHVDRAYTRMLTFSMAHRWVIVGVCAMVIASLVLLFRASASTSRRTKTNRGSRSRSGCRWASLAATTSLMERIARDMREQLPGVSDTLSFPGGGGGGIRTDERRQPVRAAEADSTSVSSRSRS